MPTQFNYGWRLTVDFTRRLHCRGALAFARRSLHASLLAQTHAPVVARREIFFVVQLPPGGENT